MRKAILKYSIFFIAFSFSNSFLFSTSATWTGEAGDQGWNNSRNWSGNPAVVPGAGDTATFDGSVGGTVIINGPRDINVVNVAGGNYSFVVGTGDLDTTGGGAAFNILGGAQVTANGSVFDSGAEINVLRNGLLTINGLMDVDELNINGGAIRINGAHLKVSSDIEINAGGILVGSCVIDDGIDTNNRGIISPGIGNEFGIFATQGGSSIELNAGSTYRAKINALGNGDMLSSSANLNPAAGSILELNPLPGVYSRGQSTPIGWVNGGGAIAVIPIQRGPIRYSQAIISGDTLVVTILQNTIILPRFKRTANNQKIVNYLFGDPNITGAAKVVANTLLNVPASEFANALIQISPIQNGGYALVGFQNNLHVANMMVGRANRTFCMDCKDRYPQMWAEPLFYYYHQDARNELYSFDNYNYGTSYGIELPASDILTFFSSLAYTHSGIVFSPNGGNAHMNTIYLAGGLGVANRYAFFNALVQGDLNFIGTKRRLQFTGFAANASGRHNSYDLLIRVQSGFRPTIDESQTTFFQPEGEINFWNSWERGFKETGAGNMNLEVKNKHSVYLQPNAKLRVIQELKSKNFCFTPNGYLGWLVNLPITSGRYTANMYNIIAAESEFNVTSYHEYANQLTFGAEFVMSNCEKILLTVRYDGSALTHFNIHSVNIRMEFKF